MDSTTRDLTQTITSLATPLAASLGLAIWGVEVVPAGRCVIRVYAESLEAFTENRSIFQTGPEQNEAGQNEAGQNGLAQADFDQAELGQTRLGQNEASQNEPDQTELAQNDLDQAGPDQHEAGRHETGHHEPDYHETGMDALEEGAVSQGGISIDQCAELSRLLGLTLEVEDCVPSAYVLEVSSPGLNRLFFQPEQLARALGVKVEATMVKPLSDFPGRKKFIGTVVKVEGDVCTLSVTEPEDVHVDIPWGDIKKIRQIYVMPEKKLPGKSLKNTRQKKSAAKKKK